MSAALQLQAAPASMPEIYRGICQVAKAISREGISKQSRNQQQGYRFRGIDDVQNALSALLAEAEICILPRMVSRSQQERSTAKGGTLFYVTVQADFDFVSARDGSRHTVTMYGEAMDSADKATNKAMSAAYKYACLQVFCIPTEGMPDADATTPEACGSQAAADAVAQRKIAEMRKSPQPAVEIVEQLPEPQDEPSAEEDYSQEEPTQLEQELHESIRMCEQLRPRNGNQPSRDEMLQAFDGLRERYQRVGFPRTLANILGRYGKRCPEDFEVSELQEARAAYKECSLDLSAREAKCRR
jgi:ERF superfamily